MMILLIPFTTLIDPILIFFRGGVMVQYPSVRDSYGLCIAPFFLLYRCVHAVLKPAEFPTPDL